MAIVYDLNDRDRRSIIEALILNYGIQTDNLVKCDGFIDQTFKVNDMYIAKIFWDPFISNQQHIDAEIRLIKFLKQRGLPVPEVISTKSGNFHCLVDMTDRQNSLTTSSKFMRVQPLLEGRTWFEARTLNPEIAEAAGDITGRMDSALADFQDDFFKSQVKHDFDEYNKIREMIKFLKDDRKRCLVEKFCELFEHKVLPHAAQLPKQQIHSDAHWGNLFVDEKCQTITGIIDFSNSKVTFRVQEVAIVIPSLFMAQDPYETIGAYLRAYCKQCPLTALEKELLWIFLCSRMCLIMLGNEKMAALDPKFDANYVTAVMGDCWTVLERLLNSDKELDSLHSSFLI